MGKKKKIRAEFRKNRGVRARPSDWTRKYREHGFKDEAPLQGERISGKGDLVRRRTICGEQLDAQRRARLRRATRGRRKRVPPRTGAQRVRAGQHGRGSIRLRLPMLDAAAVEDARHRSAPRGGRRRPRRVSPRRKRRFPRRAASSGSSRATVASAGRFAAGSKSSSPTSISWPSSPARSSRG